MSRITVYRSPTRSVWKRTPFLLDVQTDFIAALSTRVVVPLRARGDFPAPLERSTSVLDVEGKHVVMDTAALTALPGGALRTDIADLRGSRRDIDNALDFLFQGI